MATDLPIPPAVLAKLRQVNDGLDHTMNKHDRLAVLIPVCIMEGITAGNLICPALKLCGYDPDHVGILLSKGADSMPPEHRWYKDGNRQYRLP